MKAASSPASSAPCLNPFMIGPHSEAYLPWKQWSWTSGLLTYSGLQSLRRAPWHWVLNITCEMDKTKPFLSEDGCSSYPYFLLAPVPGNIEMTESCCRKSKQTRHLVLCLGCLCSPQSLSCVGKSLPCTEVAFRSMSATHCTNWPCAMTRGAGQGDIQMS